MNNLSRKEIKAILIVHKRARYDNIEQIKESYSILTERGVLISPKAVEYGERLKEIAGGNPDIYSCVMCGKEATGEKGVICDTCVALMNGLLSGEIVNSDGMVPSKPAEASEDEQGEETEEKEQKKLKLPKIKIKKPKLSLDLKISKKLAVGSIAIVIITLGLGIYCVVSTNLMYKKAEWVGEEAVKTLVEGKTSSEEIGDSASNVSSEKLDVSDLFVYLGSNYQILSSSLGESKAVVTDNVRFFSEIGATVIYDEHNDRITYIDLDASGNGVSSILGVKPGMSRERVIKQLGSFGITEPSKKDGETHFYYLVNEEINFKASLAVTYNVGEVILVSIQLVS